MEMGSPPAQAIGELGGSEETLLQPRVPLESGPKTIDLHQVQTAAPGSATVYASRAVGARRHVHSTVTVLARFRG